MEINNLTDCFAFDSLPCGKRASNLIGSSSIPRKVMTADGPTVFSSAKGTPSSAYNISALDKLF